MVWRVALHIEQQRLFVLWGLVVIQKAIETRDNLLWCQLVQGCVESQSGTLSHTANLFCDRVYAMLWVLLLIKLHRLFLELAQLFDGASVQLIVEVILLLSGNTRTIIIVVYEYDIFRLYRASLFWLLHGFFRHRTTIWFRTIC